MRHIPENNLAYPVLIKMDTNGCGSGFFLKSKNSLYLVSAKHVFLNQSDDSLLCKKEFSITSYAQDILIKEPMKITIQIELLKNEIKKHNIYDVVVIKIGDLKFNPETKIENVIFLDGVNATQLPEGFLIVWTSEEQIKKYDDVLISNDIYILGYPVSVGEKGNDQIDKDRPLLRKGIVAGKNESKRTIILDSPVYFGNSGGLVIEKEENNGIPSFLPIGIITQYIPFVEELFSLQHKEIVSINRANSGYSIAVSIDTILDLI